MSKGKVHYSIELAHIYASHLARGPMLKDEQLWSIETARRLLGKLDTEGISYSLCVLVDDYHEGKQTAEVNVDGLVKELMNAGCNPDFLVLESNLTRLGGRLLGRIPGKYLTKLGGQLVFSADNTTFPLGAESNVGLQRTGVLEGSCIVDSGKFDQPGSIGVDATGPDSLANVSSNNSLGSFSCPLLTACWYLFRLGVVGFGDVGLPTHRLSDRPIVGEKLLTILPTKYIALESRVLEILASVSTRSISKRRRDVEYYFFSNG